jgi:flavin reductase (DIM6/NTAB) family NADH-FMN oxidoreductase RutF
MAIPQAEAVFSLLDREIWLLTARAGNQRGGLIAAQVGQASIVADEPRFWVGLSPQHHTTALIHRAGSFLLHLVAPAHLDLVWQFGTRSGHDEDKLANRVWEESRLGHPRLPDAVAWLECSVQSYVSTGDREFFLAQVRDAAKVCDAAPLTLQQFHRLLSPAQAAGLRSRLIRDAYVDADLIRRWEDSGYQPAAISSPRGRHEC